MQRQPKKILILRLGAIGDVVHTTIIPKAIKEAHPDYIIHYLTQPENMSLLETSPYVDKVYLWDRKNRRSVRYFFEIVSLLYKERYDIIFNLTNAIRNILFSLFACPKKIVSRKKTNGLWVEDYFYTAKSVIKDITLPSRLELAVNDDIDLNLSGYKKPYTIIIPGGKTDKNRQGRLWSIENWERLADEILKKYGGTIFVCGGKGEQEYHSSLAKENIVVTSGKYNLAGTSALLSYADLVVSGDTGPLHIASAHNVNTLALLGSTSPDKIKPYGENGYYISADTDCKYCWRKKCKYIGINERITPCMDKITVEMVMDKIKKEKLL